jgi:hypothetical protein
MVKTMNVTLSRSAEIALQTMGDDDRRKVDIWFDYLKQWEQDLFVK